MLKILLGLMFLWLHVNAEEAFKETRYVYALDSTFVYEGTIDFQEEQITIAYQSPSKETIVYYKDDMVIEKAYFFMVLYAIHTGDEALMHTYFTTSEEGNKLTLFPKEMLAEFIQKVEVIKEQQQLTAMTIYMQNEDRITIETR